LLVFHLFFVLGPAVLLAVADSSMFVLLIILGSDLESGKDFKLSTHWNEWAAGLWTKHMGTPQDSYIEAVPYKINLYGQPSASGSVCLSVRPLFLTS
jgi:hypothetical protein